MTPITGTCIFFCSWYETETLHVRAQLALGRFFINTNGVKYNLFFYDIN